MQSQLVPDVLYSDMGRDITEHDLDIVSDLWTIDGHEVYRGARDPGYTHANVYWLYSEDLDRVGLSEHSLTDQADFRVLWFQDTEFGTVLQEDGWEKGEDIWTLLPRPVFDRFVNEGWTTPMTFLEQCLYGPMRIFTPSMARTMPQVYTCSSCGSKSLKPMSGCTMTSEPLDFPESEKVLFVDDDMLLYRPPPSSCVWDLLIRPQPPSPSGDSREPVREPAPSEPTPPPEPETPPRTQELSPP